MRTTLDTIDGILRDIRKTQAPATPRIFTKDKDHVRLAEYEHFKRLQKAEELPPLVLWANKVLGK